MRVAFAGGGTGGHLFPGLALAEELRRRAPEARLMFLCTDRDGAYGGLDAPWLEVAVLPGRHRGSLPVRVASLLPAAAGAMQVLLRFRPHVVVGCGGYGSLAPVLCARALRIPSLLLEQNVVPGRANRLLQIFASELACQWEEALPFFRYRHKARVTGNPVTARVRRHDRAKAAAALDLDPAAPTLLVMGGSQGATPLNNLVVEALPHLAQAHTALQFVHLTGATDCDRVRAAYESHGMRATVRAFLRDVSLAFSACDLALARAGGTSIAESTALGIPSLLVPLPCAVDNHQFLNARVLEYHGAGVLLDQKTLSPERLATEVAELLGNKLRLGYMASRSRRVGVPRAASVVADRILALHDASQRPRRERRAMEVAPQRP